MLFEEQQQVVLAFEPIEGEVTAQIRSDEILLSGLSTGFCPSDEPECSELDDGQYKPQVGFVVKDSGSAISGAQDTITLTVEPA